MNVNELTPDQAFYASVQGFVLIAMFVGILAAWTALANVPSLRNTFSIAKGPLATVGLVDCVLIVAMVIFFQFSVEMLRRSFLAERSVTAGEGIDTGESEKVVVTDVSTTEEASVESEPTQDRPWGKVTPDRIIASGIGTSFQLVAMAFIVLLIQLRTACKPSFLGWRPKSIREDTLYGVWILFLLLPILFGLSYAVNVISGVQYEHPVIDTMQTYPWLFGLVAWMAVIVAPITEEFFFRTMLIGWMESIHFGDKPRSIWNGWSPLTKVVEFEDGALAKTYHPPWWPAIASGVLFGLAHLSYGMSWIPLVLFGIALGRIYQWRQSLVTCIAIHMVFNGLNLLNLWLRLGWDPTSSG
jgi:membrane protease YdiL (CAAX protease family)